MDFQILPVISSRPISEHIFALAAARTTFSSPKYINTAYRTDRKQELGVLVSWDPSVGLRQPFHRRTVSEDFPTPSSPFVHLYSFSLPALFSSPPPFPPLHIPVLASFLSFVTN